MLGEALIRRERRPSAQGHSAGRTVSGALTADGRWVNSRRGFLFPVNALSKVFREKFIDALKQAR